MCRLRFLEIYIDLGTATWKDFETLTSLICSICISLAYPATLEHLEFNIRFRGHGGIEDFEETFYNDFREVWSHLDFITTHPPASQLQRVSINISYAFCYDVGGEEPDDEEVLNAVVDGLPSLHNKGILFVKAGAWSLDDRVYEEEDHIEEDQWL